MFKRGARNFVFMGRSGADKQMAKTTVEDLQAAGANVVVIRGDVASCSDVERAVLAATRPIGGIMHAAMSIHVSHSMHSAIITRNINVVLEQAAPFQEMTQENWHAGINQKVNGAWNLYDALAKTNSTKNLDFFLMLSSMYGSIGSTSESNYCAANSFLDAFSFHLRSLSIPATALGLGMISEIGFLHENPEAEATLFRRGWQPLSELDFIQMIDIAISTTDKDCCSSTDFEFGKHHYMQSHLLAGLEFRGRRDGQTGHVVTETVLKDPRLTYSARVYDQRSEGGTDEIEGYGSIYPQKVAVALASNEDVSSPNKNLIEAVAKILTGRMATLLLVPETELNTTMELADFNMESLLAAEFRSDIFRAFKVDISFSILMAKGTKVITIGELVAQELLKRKHND
jgi:hypothetical protein